MADTIEQIIERLRKETNRQIFRSSSTIEMTGKQRRARRLIELNAMIAYSELLGQFDVQIPGIVYAFLIAEADRLAAELEKDLTS